MEAGFLRLTIRTIGTGHMFERCPRRSMYVFSSPGGSPPDSLLIDSFTRNVQGVASISEALPVSQSSKGEAAALPPMICAICQRVLDIQLLDDGFHYRHTLQDETQDHEPVPTSPTDDWSGGRCDFCNTGRPTFELPVRDFSAPVLEGHMSRGNWS